MMKGNSSERKLMPDIKSIASKKESDKFLVQEVKFTMRNLQNTPKTDFMQFSNVKVRERKGGLLKLNKRTENLSECSNSIALYKVDEITAK